MMYNLSIPTYSGGYEMAPATIRQLLELLDGDDKLADLDAARAMREDYEGNESTRGIIVRIYTDIVIGLCAIWLTGPSHEIGDRFDRAGRAAALLHNNRLAMLASWYETCCRTMRRLERTDIVVPDTVWVWLRVHFGMVGDRARRTDDSLRYALASALECECQARMQMPPQTLSATAREIRSLIQQANQSDLRVIECARLLDALANTGQLPAVPVDYGMLLYTEGELLETIT